MRLWASIRYDRLASRISLRIWSAFISMLRCLLCVQGPGLAMERILKSREGGDHQVISVAEVQLLPWPVSANFLQSPQGRQGRNGRLQAVTSGLSHRASASRIGHPCPRIATP